MEEYSSKMEDVQVQENEVAKTETSIPPEPLSKHPLEHKWTLWYYDNNKKNSWLNNLHNVYTFDTVEDFWCLYNHIKPVYSLPIGCDYALFKEEIKPSWEDRRNTNGGRWLMTVADNRMKNLLPEMWLNLLLFMIGESFDECSDGICGAYMNARGKHDKISLWTADKSNKNEVEYIGKKLKYDCLHLPPDFTITYDSHEVAMKKSGRDIRDIPPLYYV